ncbi:peroxisomal membrane protein PEX14-like [Planoprotostelium fungivorum]|uniref:Peroxisomal membrane protein PEX14 n=1 Tax=Planoprotostelium fungivorum TaxID=1890364 RepID=A0A2P6NL40_9EUKA|nr:peroxisomal membrane protein PEX14-like [Planoprotostelium fungivorum]
MSDPKDEKTRDPDEEAEAELEAEEKRQAEKKARAERVRQRREELRKRAQADEAEEKSEPAKKTASTEPEAPKIRESLIESSINFLNHPRVKPSPKDQKIAFLKKKGLTTEEIDEAFRRVSGDDASAVGGLQQPASRPVGRPANEGLQVPPPPYYPPPQQQIIQAPPVQPGWYQTGTGLALIIFGAAGLGLGASYVAQKLIPWFSGNDTKKAAEEAERKAKENQIVEQLMSSVKAMQDRTDSMQEMMRTLMVQQQQTTLLSQAAASANHQPAPLDAAAKLEKIKQNEMEAELKKLRAILMDRNAAPAGTQSWTPPTNKPSLPSWQTTPKSSTLSTSVAPTTPPTQPASQPAPTAQETTMMPQHHTDRLAQLASGVIPDDVDQNLDDAPRGDGTIEKSTREVRPKPWQRKSEDDKSEAGEATASSVAVSEGNSSSQ